MECSKLVTEACPHISEMVKNRRLEAAIDGNWETMVREAEDEQEQFCPSCGSFEPLSD